MNTKKPWIAIPEEVQLHVSACERSLLLEHCVEVLLDLTQEHLILLGHAHQHIAVLDPLEHHLLQQQNYVQDLLVSLVLLSDYLSLDHHEYHPQSFD